MQVPFVDLGAQYEQIKDEVKEKVMEVIESRKFIQGPYAKDFAKVFAEVHGSKYAVGCSNGTHAITVALRTLGIGPGDEVITVANTYIASIEAILEVGAKAVFS